MTTFSFRARSLALLAALPLTACQGGSGNNNEAPPDASGGSVDASDNPVPDADVPDPDAQVPLLGYGEVCEDGNDCSSGLCVGIADEDWLCSRSCNGSAAHDCRAEDAFCIPLAAGGNACYGAIDVGTDTDETILMVGDSASRGFHNLTDVDMFPLHVSANGDAIIRVTPDPLIDVQIDVYNALGELAAIGNDEGPGVAEAILYEGAQVGDIAFAVVKNVGTSTGDYTIEFVPAI